MKQDTLVEWFVGWYVGLVIVMTLVSASFPVTMSFIAIIGILFVVPIPIALILTLVIFFLTRNETSDTIEE